MIRVAEECEWMMCLIELVIISWEVALVSNLLLPFPSGTDLCLCVVYRKCSLQFSEHKDSLPGTVVQEISKTLTYAWIIVNMHIFTSMFSLPCISKKKYTQIDSTDNKGIIMDPFPSCQPRLSTQYITLFYFSVSVMNATEQQKLLH